MSRNLSDPCPVTDYTGPVACPQCGQKRPAGRTEVYCLPCMNIGHNYRLMGAAELQWCARRDAQEGYAEVAARKRGIAAALEATPDDEVFMAGSVRARRLKVGERVAEGDLYFSTTGKWAPCPLAGFTLTAELNVTYARPIHAGHVGEPDTRTTNPDWSGAERDQDASSKRIVARWESRGGKHWIELYADQYGYGYSGNDCCGNLGRLPDDAAAIESLKKGALGALCESYTSTTRVR